MGTTKWSLIGRIARSKKSLITGTLIAGFAYNIFTILIPISVGKFYEFAFDFSSHRLKAFGFIPYLNSSEHSVFFLLFFGFVVLRFALEYANKYGIALVGEQVAKDLRERLFEAQMKIALPIYEEKGIGKYLLRFSGDLASIQNYVKNGLLRFIQDVLLLLVVTLVIAYIDLALALLIFCFITCTVVVLALLNKVLYGRTVERRNRKSGMLSFVNTRLRGIKSLKAFNKYTPENKRYRKRSQRLFSAGKKYAGTVSLIQAIIPAMTYAMLGVIMIYVLYAQNNGIYVGSGSLLVVILLIISILPVLRRTLRVSIVWKLGNISFYKLIKIFQLPKENSLVEDEQMTGDLSLHIQNITYSHGPSKTPVYQNFSVDIPSNAMTLFYGPSGCGKSTLVKLLLKNTSPDSGEIKMGDFSYQKLSEKTVRKHIAVISKDYPLYGKNVYEAIAYSRNESRRHRVQKLLQELQKSEELKNKLSLTDPIGDMGSNLNSGQKKLLMYCRAFLTNKAILLIEEPFEHLSPGIALLIAKKLNVMRSQKTIIVLTQSQASLFEPDFSICLESKISLEVT